ncbi:MAG: methyltransferase domain-containing protein [Cyanobacteria bacterium P01_G01_bin.39]
MNKIKLDKFKREIAAAYDRRQSTYDRGKAGNWHYNLACRLVECADLQRGNTVLDLATGTGMVAIEAAQKVGDSGQVIGIDIASGLLQVAQQKINKAKLDHNIKLQLADVEALSFDEGSFDCIFCCSALPLFKNCYSCLDHFFTYVGFQTNNYRPRIQADSQFFGRYYWRWD